MNARVQRIRVNTRKKERRGSMAQLLYKMALAFLSYSFFKIVFNNTPIHNIFIQKFKINNRKRMLTYNFIFYIIISMVFLGIELLIKGAVPRHIYSYYIGMGILFASIDRCRSFIDN